MPITTSSRIIVNSIDIGAAVLLAIVLCTDFKMLMMMIHSVAPHAKMPVSML